MIESNVARLQRQRYQNRTEGFGAVFAVASQVLGDVVLIPGILKIPLGAYLSKGKESPPVFFFVFLTPVPHSVQNGL